MKYREDLLVFRFTTIVVINIYNFAVGLGGYKLLPKFISAAKSPDELGLITCHSPEEIVSRLSNKSPDASVKGNLA